MTVIIGLSIAFLSRFNTSNIILTIGDYTYSNIPLYAITVGTYIIGILLAWIIEIPQGIATAFQIIGLGRTISSGKNTIGELQNKIKRLEIENIKLVERNQTIISNRRPGENSHHNTIHNLLHRLHLR